MRKIHFAFLGLLVMAGCACQQPAAGVAVQALPAQAVMPMAASPCGAQAPLQVAAQPVGYVLGSSVGVQYQVGPAEYGRAALGIPGDVVVCIGNGLRCVLNAFWPTPQPAAHYVNVVPVQAMGACTQGACAPPPAAAAPCAKP